MTAELSHCPIVASLILYNRFVVMAFADLYLPTYDNVAGKDMALSTKKGTFWDYDSYL